MRAGERPGKRQRAGESVRAQAGTAVVARQIAFCVMAAACTKEAPQATGASVPSASVQPASAHTATPPSEADAAPRAVATAPVAAGPVALPLDAGVPATAKPPAAAGCLRQRQTHRYRCIGLRPGEGEPNTYPVTVCDRCVADGDCTARAGGRCLTVGGQPCEEPATYVCRYPGDACDGCRRCTLDAGGGLGCARPPVKRS